MKSFTEHTGVVAPMDRANVDTDLIIPKQFLKSIKRTGFGPNLFDELRYLDKGEPGRDNSTRPINPEFPLNFARYKGASILLARENFGCGSSREHAPWALEEFGIRAVIAPSYADIFYNNCFKNGLLPIVLDEKIVSSLFKSMYDQVGYKITIDLQQQSVIANGEKFAFEIDEFRKHCLLNGFDDISLTLQEAEKIKIYEQQRRTEKPWLFGAVKA
ncbi:3-isopropylmalate dehydratase, small subunit [Alteromonadaceae bacterium Bs31]|nr:3-isopropylmalate dehydratase, small subunit [Alteromonadaceae bacterium Bs31]